MWGTDATMDYTLKDGWEELFARVDRYTSEASTHLAARGYRFAALQPVCSAVIDRRGTLKADIARGIPLRHDWDRSTALGTSSIRSAGWA